MKNLLLLLIMLPGILVSNSQACDPDLEMDRQIDAILHELTPLETITLLAGERGFFTTAIPRLGLPGIRMGDGPMGLNQPKKATAFPASIAMAATFDTDLIQQLGQAIGRECRQQGIGILLAPGVNIYRIPQNGRNYEYYGEDPFLSGRMAVAFIQGVQQHGVLATVKHFACNNLEYDRHRTDSQVDERTLHEIYLPAFRAAVQEGKCAAVMTAYNLVNGKHCSENDHLLTNILRKRWGFTGVIMSDWISLYSTQAVQAGLDLEMPKAQFMTVENLSAALKEGTVSLSDLQAKARRIIAMALKAKQASIKIPLLVDFNAHLELSRQISETGTVLLKNENHVLPLTPQKQDTIAVIGPNARRTPSSGSGAAFVEPGRKVSHLQAMQRQSRGRGKVMHIKWQPESPWSGGIAPKDREKLSQCRAVLVCVGFNDQVEGEGHDRPFALPLEQEQLILEVAALNAQTIIVLNAGGGVDMENWIEQVPALLHNWYPGVAGDQALAGILFGDVNPSGKLPISIEKKWNDAAAYGAYDEEKSRPGLPPLFTLYGQAHEVIPVPYKEGVYVGYRHFDKKQIVPQFPFGHGLSYTRFEYDQMQVTSGVDNRFLITIGIRNSGTRRGAEVVQLYVHDRECSVDRPVKELKGFARVELDPGEHKRVDIGLDRSAFAFYNVAKGQWQVEPGEFEILIGSSSQDIRLRQTVAIHDEMSFQ